MEKERWSTKERLKGACSTQERRSARKEDEGASTEQRVNPVTGIVQGAHWHTETRLSRWHARHRDARTVLCKIRHTSHWHTRVTPLAGTRGARRTLERPCHPYHSRTHLSTPYPVNTHMHARRRATASSHLDVRGCLGVPAQARAWWRSDHLFEVVGLRSASVHTRRSFNTRKVRALIDP